jgi:hypothetical protein
MTKRLFSLCLLLVLLAPAVSAQKIKQKKVPHDLLVVFRDTYPAATQLEWRKHPDGYQVKFENLGKLRLVVYGSDLRWTYKESQLSTAEIPLAAIEYMREKQPDCDIVSVRVVEKQQDFQLECELQCPGSKKTTRLFFDRMGRVKENK